MCSGDKQTDKRVEALTSNHLFHRRIKAERAGVQQASKTN